MSSSQQKGSNNKTQHTKKAQRSAKRKSGWKQYAQGMKEVFIDSAGNIIKEANNNLFKQGLIKGTANAVTNTIPKVVQGGVKAAKGLIKGIFNDPSFYNAWVNPMLAMNENRPVETQDLLRLSNLTTGMGVPYIIDTNFKFIDLTDNRAFNFACDKVYELIRNNLKSNLPYKVQEVRDYLISVIPIAIYAAELERSLTWYNFSDPKKPNLRKAFGKFVPGVGAGFGNCSNISVCNDPDLYAYAVTRLNTLNELLANIRIPERLGKFIKHYFSNVFADETGSNRQFYRVNVLSVPVIDYDNSTSYTVNPLDINIDNLIDIVESIRSRFGLVIADIGKFDILPTISPIVQGNPTAIVDASLFNVLINAYSTLDFNTDQANPINGCIGNLYNDYVRIDFQDSLPQESKIDALIGMGAILASNNANNDDKYDVHFLELINQGCIFYATKDMSLTGLGQSGISEGGTIYNDLEMITEEGFKYFSVTSNMLDQIKCIVANPNTSAAAESYQGSWQSPVSVRASDITESVIYMLPESDYTLDTKFTIASSEFIKLTEGFFFPLFQVVLSDLGRNAAYGVLYNTSDGTVKATRIYVYEDGSVVEGSTTTWDSLQTSETDLSSYNGQRIVSFKSATNVFYTGSPGDELILNAMIGTDAVVLYNYNYANTFAVTTPMGSGASSFTYSVSSSIGADFLPWFLEQVEYHIPIWYTRDVLLQSSVASSDKLINHFTSRNFCKSSYNTVVINLYDAHYTLYDMVVSLFSINNIDRKR